MSEFKEVTVTFQGRIQPRAEVMLVGPLYQRGGIPPRSYEANSTFENQGGSYCAIFNVPLHYFHASSAWKLVVSDCNNAMNASERELVIPPDPKLLRGKEPIEVVGIHTKEIEKAHRFEELLTNIDHGVTGLAQQIGGATEAPGQPVETVAEKLSDLKLSVSQLPTAVDVTGQFATAKSDNEALVNPVAKMVNKLHRVMGAFPELSKALDAAPESGADTKVEAIQTVEPKPQSGEALAAEPESLQASAVANPPKPPSDPSSTISDGVVPGREFEAVSEPTTPSPTSAPEAPTLVSELLALRACCRDNAAQIRDLTKLIKPGADLLKTGNEKLEWTLVKLNELLGEQARPIEIVEIVNIVEGDRSEKEAAVAALAGAVEEAAVEVELERGEVAEAVRQLEQEKEEFEGAKDELEFRAEVARQSAGIFLSSLNPYAINSIELVFKPGLLTESLDLGDSTHKARIDWTPPGIYLNPVFRLANADRGTFGGTVVKSEPTDEAVTYTVEFHLPVNLKAPRAKLNSWELVVHDLLD